MKLSTNMITTNDAKRNIRPPTLSLVLLATKLKNGTLYNNKVPMLMIHEKAKSEMGLRNNIIICSFSFFIEFHNLGLAKVEDQARRNKADDATHAYIRQEVLRKVDT